MKAASADTSCDQESLNVLKLSRLHTNTISPIRIHHNER